MPCDDKSCSKRALFKILKRDIKKQQRKIDQVTEWHRANAAQQCYQFYDISLEYSDACVMEWYTFAMPAYSYNQRLLEIANELDSLKQFADAGYSAWQACEQIA